ncbi:MAG: RHS repeat-associated core domain-containing protein [Anaerolineales bacterium]|nr:MAG: RHS repeat-associated core domain-containing protein [Anaerolineales bacterium]
MSLTYDKAGRKLTMNDPDMGFWQYSYNALGGMTRQEDAKNQVACLYYDELNRPRGKDYFTNSAACPSDPGSGYEVTYNYDSTANGNLGKGRRTSMTDASGSTSWLYDSRGRVRKETKIISGISFDTEWTYNLADLPATMKYPDGEIVTTGYNNNMLPTDVSGADNYVPSMTYDSAGRLLTRALGNGLTQNYVYYPWNQQGGRLQSLTTGTLQNLAYQYDPVGNITQITNSVAGETSVYDYDALDRLTSWQLNQDTPETYAYDDDTGNLIEKNDLALDYPDASGSQATHPHAVTSAAINDVIVNTYGYDQNGNQTTRHIGSDTFHLIYDAENRLVEVKKNGTTIAEFTFDGDGKRVMSVIDGETVRFVGGYYERKGSEITKYYMAGAARVAIRKYTIPQSMTVEYMLGDHLGSTSITTDSNGAMVSELRYKPWGELRYTWTDASASTSPAYELTRYQYTGQYSYDVEFGLKYYGARFYDSAVGRFVSADTVIPQSQGTQAYDRYAYTSNNPIKYTDPTGHRIDEGEGEKANDDESKNLTQEEDPPLCAPTDPGCDPFWQKDLTPDEIQALIDALEPLQDTLTYATIVTGVVGGLSFLIPVVGVPVGAGLVITGTELAIEAYEVSTLINYLEDAQDVAVANSSVTISFYKYGSVYGGIPTQIYYEGATAVHIVSSPMMNVALSPLGSEVIK